MILKQLLTELLQRVKNEDSKSDMIYWAAHYENRLRCGDKAIIFIEAFMARVMLIIHNNKQQNN